MENNNGRPVSKEELAKQIARTVAMQSGEPEDISFRQDNFRSAFSDDDIDTDRERSRSSERRSSSSSQKSKKKKKGMSTGGKAVIAIFSILVAAGAALTGAYLYGINSVQGKFLANTSINGHDVSGLTQKEAYDLLTEDNYIPEKITINMPGGSDITITLEQIGYKDNIRTTVAQYYTQQNHYLWFRNLFTATEYSFDASFSYDEDKLKSQVKRKIVDFPGSTEPEDAFIHNTDDGFEIIPEVMGDKIDPTRIDELYDYVNECVESGDYTVDVTVLDLYQQPKVTAEDLTEQLNKLNSLYNIEINYDFIYTTHTLTGAEVMDWIIFDKNDPYGDYTVDAEKAMAYVEGLAEKYDTYDKPRKFNSTSRGEITVEQGRGCYGWWIDQQRTCDQLVEIIEEGSSANIEPIYYKNPNSGYTFVCDPKYRTAESDIGDTYCEVDLAKQHFWYYKDGKLTYECDIVSGMPTEERNTPGGVYKVWYKELNKTLSGTLSTGETWSTPVTYWNNISTFGVGLHDATWHPYFGGDRYKNYGSHGCINMPYDAAKYVYENIDLNTPVVCYW